MPAPLTLPELARRTLPELLERARVFGAERPFVIDLGSDRTLSYGEFLERVSAAAHRLSARFAPGARIAVMLSNRLELVILRYALSCAGLVEVAVNGAHKGPILRAMLETAAPDGLVVEAGFAQNLAGCGFATAGRALLDERALRALTGGRAPWADRPRPAIAPGDPARVLFTSGTSGASKGVELSHAYEVTTGERHVARLRLSAADRWLMVTPLSHIDALYIVSILLHVGGCFVLAPRFSASDFWAQVARSEATLLCYLGAILAILLKGEGAPVERSLRLAIGGGCSAAMAKAIEARFGVRVVEAFAMTECIACTINDPDDPRPGTVGRPLKGYQVAILDPEGRALAPGVTGEIAVRCTLPFGLMTRYLGDPAASEAAFRGGWFHSGDLGALDGDGYLTYRGRLKDMIRRRGENISASELEAVANDHPSVQASAALGVPAALGEEEVLLMVEPRPGARLDPAELSDFLADRVAPFMVPLYIKVVDRLARTTTGKVAKTELAWRVDEATWMRGR